MAKCRRCSLQLDGRRQLCDGCKADRPGTAETVAARKTKAATRTKPAAKTRNQAGKRTARAREAPPGLHARGRQLWSDLGAATADTTAGHLALEVCRAADRLEELDRIIAGKGVLQLMQFRLDHIGWDAQGDEHIHVRVGFQSVLTEARLQQGNFAALLKEYRAMVAVTPPTSSGAPAGQAAPPATGLDEFSQRRAERVTQTS